MSRTIRANAYIVSETAVAAGRRARTLVCP